MKRMKTFLIYALLIIGFYLLTNFFIYGYMVKVYKPIENININTSSPAVHITDAKSTFINGYLIGRITNNIGQDINATYLQIDFYSSKNVRMGRKHMQIEDFANNETKEFKVNFQFQDIKRLDISFTNEEPEQVEEIKITETHKLAFLAAMLIVMYWAPLPFL